MSNVELGKIVNIRTGKLDANASSENGEYPFFTCSKEPLSIDSYSYDCECVLVAGNGDLNVKYYSGKFDAYQRTYIIEASDKRKLFMKYLYYFVDSIMDFIRSQSIGGVIKYIKLGDLTSLKLPLPSLERQREIAEVLDKASKLVEKRKAQLAELDLLAESVFYDMFGDPVTNENGWEIDSMKQITTKIGSGATPKGGNESYKDEGISLIRSLNVHNGVFKYKDLAHIDDNQAAALSNVTIESNDILLNITGASVARCCIVPNDILPARVNQHVAIVRLIKERVDYRFLCCQLISIQYQQKLLSVGKSNGATREALTKANVEDLQVILPPLLLQQQFAERIEKIEEQKQKVKTALEESQNLFQRLMQDMFNHEL